MGVIMAAIVIEQGVTLPDLPIVAWGEVILVGVEVLWFGRRDRRMWPADVEWRQHANSKHHHQHP